MLTNGTFLGNRYEIIEKIGTGGMSDVYRAKDHSLSRDIAIKVLKPEFANDSAFVSKFRAEAQAAAARQTASTRIRASCRLAACLPLVAGRDVLPAGLFALFGRSG